MVNSHFEDGQFVQPPWDCVACRDHLCQLRHVPVHPLATSLLYFAMLGAPVNDGGRVRGRRGTIGKEAEGGGGRGEKGGRETMEGGRGRRAGGQEEQEGERDRWMRQCGLPRLTLPLR